MDGLDELRTDMMIIRATMQQHLRLIDSVQVAISALETVAHSHQIRLLAIEDMVRRQSVKVL